MKPAAIVSGACQGIGLAVCRRLLPEWDIAIVDSQPGDEIAASLAHASGARVLAYRADIADPEAVASVFARIPEDFPQPLRGLVNSAGIYSETDPGQGTDEEELRLFRVNVLGAQHLVNAAVPLMMKAGAASIVTLSSLAGRMGADAAGESYTGSKSDLIGRSKQWAKVYGPSGIRSNIVAPGPVKTAMIRSWTPDRYRDFIARTPLRRVAEPEDIASAVAFLLGPESRHITGVCLDVNGGYYIAP